MRPPKGGISGFSRAVDADGEVVVAGLEVAGEAGLERGVAVLVGDDLRAVERHMRIGHGAVEDQGDFAALPGGIGDEASSRR